MKNYAKTNKKPLFTRFKECFFAFPMLIIECLNAYNRFAQPDNENFSYGG
jgi:hypothetical protein